MWKREKKPSKVASGRVMTSAPPSEEKPSGRNYARHAGACPARRWWGATARSRWPSGDVRCPAAMAPQTLRSRRRSSRRHFTAGRAATRPRPQVGRRLAAGCRRSAAGRLCRDQQRRAFSCGQRCRQPSKLRGQLCRHARPAANGPAANAELGPAQPDARAAYVSGHPSGERQLFRCPAMGALLRVYCTLAPLVLGDVGGQRTAVIAHFL